MNLSLSEINKDLPLVDTNNYRSQNHFFFQELDKTCIVIDDDPTGNQTVYNIPLLTQWDINTIVKEFNNKTPIFYILTNSRSLTTQESRIIYQEIALNIAKASQLTNRNFSIISRSDSTLRGHFPSEIIALKNSLDYKEVVTILIPVMFEGKRVTVNDIHYIEENSQLIPVSKTPFALDKSFGYSKSNLKEWIEEKTDGEVKLEDVHSISIQQIRSLPVNDLAHVIANLPNDSYCVVNALNYQDLDKIANAFLVVEKTSKKLIYRTSSSFVPSYIGLKPKDLLSVNELLNANTKTGGLTIVGSYVPKSSQQLQNVLNCYQTQNIFEIEVEEILGNNSTPYLSYINEKVNSQLENGNHVLIYTSRKLIAAQSPDQNLNIGKTVSHALVDIVKNLRVRPKYILAKGGITSNDIAIEGLEMKRSKVLGQILPGIPVWEMGEETKFPKITYIVFPGNVGDDTSLLTIFNKLK